MYPEGKILVKNKSLIAIHSFLSSGFAIYIRKS